MTLSLPSSETPAPEPGPDVLVLRTSDSLQRVPPERDAAAAPAPAVQAPASAAAPVIAASPRHAAPMTAHADPLPSDAPPDRASATSQGANWVLGGAAILATLGWVIERRQRRLLETEKDSVLWADVHARSHGPGGSIITTAGNLDDILPDSPDPAEKARAIYVHAIGETNSRREATLIDLHQLNAKLWRRRHRGDNVAAVLLLQQHLVDFRYTSPWVFLELRELYAVLDRQKEWDVARDAVRQRFGQNAPLWTSPSNVDAQLAEDAQLLREITQGWPFREARMSILRWMLGDPDMRQKGMGPPLLPLGVYRDMMLLDEVLDEVMITKSMPVDSML
jgi:hypothetical protein